MATELLMPKLGMTMEEGTIVHWFKKVGEQVAEGEVILEILTDKVNMEVEAPATGQLLALFAAEGEILPVNTPIAFIGQPGEKVPTNTGSAAPAEAEIVVASVPAAEATSTPGTQVGVGGKVKASPAAKRVAREEQIDLKQVPATGPDGRIVAEDVRKYKASPLALKIAQDKGVDLSLVTGTGIGGKVMKNDVEKSATVPKGTVARNIKPLAGMRKAIADHMSDAWAAPQVTYTAEVNMSALVELRKRIVPGIEKRAGVKPSYNDIIIKVVAKALREFPIMNTRLYAEGLEECAEVNVGMAVAVPNGLIVPVVKNTDGLSIEQICKATKDLAARARNNKLLPDDMAGGTFTVTNLGMYGIETFTPIVNAPEVGILGVGKLQDKAVVVEGQVVVQPRLSLSLTCDHRAVDGAQAAQFLSRLKDLMEDYLQLI